MRFGGIGKGDFVSAESMGKSCDTASLQEAAAVLLFYWKRKIILRMNPDLFAADVKKSYTKGSK